MAAAGDAYKRLEIDQGGGVCHRRHLQALRRRLDALPRRLQGDHRPGGGVIKVDDHVRALFLHPALSEKKKPSSVDAIWDLQACAHFCLLLLYFVCFVVLCCFVCLLCCFVFFVFFVYCDVLFCLFSLFVICF